MNPTVATWSAYNLASLDTLPWARANSVHTRARIPAVDWTVTDKRTFEYALECLTQSCIGRPAYGRTPGATAYCCRVAPCMAILCISGRYYVECPSIPWVDVLSTHQYHACPLCRVHLCDHFLHCCSRLHYGESADCEVLSLECDIHDLLPETADSGVVARGDACPREQPTTTIM